jgi:hypothetical protein
MKVPTRHRREIGFVSHVFPPRDPPACRFGQIGFVSRDSTRLEGGVAPNWVRFAHLPRVPCPCGLVLPGPAEKLALFYTSHFKLHTSNFFKIGFVSHNRHRLGMVE